MPAVLPDLVVVRPAQPSPAQPSPQSSSSSSSSSSSAYLNPFRLQIQSSPVPVPVPILQPCQACGYPPDPVVSSRPVPRGFLPRRSPFVFPSVASQSGFPSHRYKACRFGIPSISLSSPSLFLPNTKREETRSLRDTTQADGSRMAPSNFHSQAVGQDSRVRGPKGHLLCGQRS